MIFRQLTGVLRKHGRISKGALERLSSTNLREKSSRVRQEPVPERPLLTLDPRKFAEEKQHRFPIGNMRSFKPSIVLHNQPSPLANREIFSKHHKVPPSYPPDTSAFLYYFSSPERPRIAGELRLRVASNDDSASFESGSDLLSLNGQPWSISLIQVSKYHIPLYSKLRQEGLVSDDLDAVLSNFPATVRGCHHLYTLNDTFIVDFSIKDLYFLVITEQGVERIELRRSFVELRPKLKSPYTGSALARFERSTLPDHEGTRTLVLRILKIITSFKCVIPNYDRFIVPPKEGELHRRCTSKKEGEILNPPVWSLNIDNRASLRGLQLLWDR